MITLHVVMVKMSVILSLLNVFSLEMIMSTTKSPSMTFLPRLSFASGRIWFVVVVVFLSCALAFSFLLCLATQSSVVWFLSFPSLYCR